MNNPRRAIHKIERFGCAAESPEDLSRGSGKGFAGWLLWAASFLKKKVENSAAKCKIPKTTTFPIKTKAARVYALPYSTKALQHCNPMSTTSSDGYAWLQTFLKAIHGNRLNVNTSKTHVPDNNHITRNPSGHIPIASSQIQSSGSLPDSRVKFSFQNGAPTNHHPKQECLVNK